MNAAQNLFQCLCAHCPPAAKVGDDAAALNHSQLTLVVNYVVVVRILVRRGGPTLLSFISAHCPGSSCLIGYSQP